MPADRIARKTIAGRWLRGKLTKNNHPLESGRAVGHGGAFLTARGHVCLCNNNSVKESSIANLPFFHRPSLPFPSCTLYLWRLICGLPCVGRALGEIADQVRVGSGRRRWMTHKNDIYEFAFCLPLMPLSGGVYD